MQITIEEYLQVINHIECPEKENKFVKHFNRMSGEQKFNRQAQEA